MLHLSVAELGLERPPRASLVDEEGCRGSILWRGRTPRPGHAGEHGVLVDDIVEDRKVLGGRDDERVPEVLAVEPVPPHRSPAHDLVRVVAPGTEADHNADLEISRVCVKVVVRHEHAGIVALPRVVVDEIHAA